MDDIIITGARENNLKNISLRIPKGKLVVVIGVSGSGKSSLVFDTIAAEAGRQLNDTFPAYVRSRLPHYDTPHVENIEHLSTAVVINQRPFTGDIRSTVGTMTDVSPLLRLLFSRCAQPALPSSSAYSFNDPQGMCPDCSGLGYTVRFDMSKVLDRSKSLNDGAILLPGHGIGTYQWQLYAKSGLFAPDKPLKDFSDREWFDLLHGSGVLVDIDNTTGKVWDKSYKLTYEGLEDRITRLYLKKDINSLNKANQRIVSDFTTECTCSTCSGSRLKSSVLESRLLGRNIRDVGQMEIPQLISFLQGVRDPLGNALSRKLIGILQNIDDIGLGYLTIDRPALTLSGGEAQRLKMIRHLNSSLTDLLYILDEPTTGLHPKDVDRLSRILLHLRDCGNTVLVVEHDPNLIRLADQVIEIGPGAGQQGGTVVFQGSVPQLCASHTPTSAALQKKLQFSSRVRQVRDHFPIRNACLHNLKHIDVDIPIGIFTVVSGVAGSGKSSLICGEFLRQHPDAVHISQSPIGISSRSTPATYVGIMDEIRSLFAKENHVPASLFSFNSKGACPVCGGRGEIRTEMAFMDPVTVTCEACGGLRFNQQALSCRYRDKTIVDVQNMTATEALDFFREPKIRKGLQLLEKVGMGYITLGQSVNTLSGGECQR